MVVPNSRVSSLSVSAQEELYCGRCEMRSMSRMERVPSSSAASTASWIRSVSSSGCRRLRVDRQELSRKGDYGIVTPGEELSLSQGVQRCPNVRLVVNHVPICFSTHDARISASPQTD